MNPLRILLPLFAANLCAALIPQSAASLPASWPQAYLDSLADTSQDATPDKISKNLIAVLRGEPNLTWDASNSRVLMETWADDKFYPTKNPGDIITVRAGHPIWVSSPPELKEWVATHAFPEADLALRLKQMLGMPPDADKTYFAEFWVNPADLVRPSPDPEITDHEAEIDFPTSPFFVISEAYKTWFNDLRSVSYTTDDAHPWTRLGYTYDWGNQYDHVAISEFIVWDGAQVEISQVTPTAEYVSITPTVLNLGCETAYTGDHIVFSACVDEFSSFETDMYVRIVSPSGVVLSLTRRGVVKGTHPYYSAAAMPDPPDGAYLAAPPAPPARRCATLLDYTVRESTQTGVWKVTLAAVPAGMEPKPRNVISSYTATVTILE